MNGRILQIWQDLHIFASLLVDISCACCLDLVQLRSLPPSSTPFYPSQDVCFVSRLWPWLRSCSWMLKTGPNLPSWLSHAMPAMFILVNSSWGCNKDYSGRCWHCKTIKNYFASVPSESEHAQNIRLQPDQTAAGTSQVGPFISGRPAEIDEFASGPIPANSEQCGQYCSEKNNLLIWSHAEVMHWLGQEQPMVEHMGILKYFWQDWTCQANWF